MNILLTTHCSLDCSYCFARSLRTTRSEMSLADLDRLVSTLDPAKDPIRLMGGEPTLHSHYVKIVRKLKAENFEVVVFTNGLHKSLRETSPYLPDRILMNVNDWESYSKAQQFAIRENLSFLGERVGLGYTILNPNFDLSIHCSLIHEYQLQPVIRLGLAQPIIGGDNAYLPDSALPEVHRQVADWAEVLDKGGIRLSFDCGFIHSQFSDEDIEKMVRARTMLRFDCVPSIDVGPGLRVWRCFAFSRFESPGCDGFENLEQLQAWFASQDALIQHLLLDNDKTINILNQDGCLARQWNRTNKKYTLNEMNLINNVSMESL